MFLLDLSYDNNAGVPSLEGERIDSRGTVSYNYYQVHLMLTSRQKEVKCFDALTWQEFCYSHVLDGFVISDHPFNCPFDKYHDEEGVLQSAHQVQVQHKRSFLFLSDFLLSCNTKEVETEVFFGRTFKNRADNRKITKHDKESDYYILTSSFQFHVSSEDTKNESIHSFTGLEYERNVDPFDDGLGEN